MIQAKKLTEGSAETLYHFAYTQYKQGKYQEAADLFRLLTAANTKTRKYWMGLGASLQMLKKYREAIEAYELAAALDPIDPQVHIYAADCFFAQKMVKEGLFALDCAERAVNQQKKPDPDLMTHIRLIRKSWKKNTEE